MVATEAIQWASKRFGEDLHRMLMAVKKEIPYPPSTILPEGHKKTYQSAKIVVEEDDYHAEDCPSCMNVIRVKNWHTPSACPICHRDRCD